MSDNIGSSSSVLWVVQIAVYILKTPNFVSSMGAFKAALKLSPKTLRESTGSMTPSSHILSKQLQLFSMHYSLKLKKSNSYLALEK